MTHAIKPSPSVKKRENGECKLSLNTGKVAAKPSEGASVSRNERIENKHEQTRKNRNSVSKAEKQF